VTAAAVLTVSCLRDRVVAPDSPLPAVLAVDRPTVQLFRFARGRMVAADTVRISNNGEGRLGPVQRVGGVDYLEGRSGWLQATVVNLDEDRALLVLVPSYAEEEQAAADLAEVVLRGAGASELKRVTVHARTLPGASFEFSVSPAAFTAVPDEPSSPQTLVVRNGGNGVLRIAAPAVEYEGQAAGWLSVTRAGGTETAPSFRLSTDPAGLQGGLYRARLRFESQATEERRHCLRLPVQLNVGPRLGVSTPSLSFTVVYGDSTPKQQAVLLANAGAGSLAALGKVDVAGISYGPGASGWLAPATDSARVSVAASARLTAPGDYQATMQLHSEHGGDQPILAPVGAILSLSRRASWPVRGEGQLPARNR
jgi:hypothetical protein